MKNRERTNSLEERNERNVRLRAEDLLLDFQAFMREFYILNLDRGAGSFKAVFKNGQIFRISVEELR